MNSNLCRICAKKVCSNGLQLFERKQKKLLLKIKDLTGLLLKKINGLPKHICPDCRNAINEAHCLRENILKVQSLFEGAENNDKQLVEPADATEFIQFCMKGENDIEDTKPPDHIFTTNENIIEKQECIIGEVKQEEENALDVILPTDDLRKSDEDNVFDTFEKETSHKVKRHRKRRVTKKSPDIFSDFGDEGENQYDDDYEFTPAIKKPRKCRNTKKYTKISEDEENPDNASDKNDEEFRLDTDLTNIYKCNFKECNYIAKSQQALKVHFLRHTGDKRFECEHCQKKFYTNAELRAHMPVHTGEKRFECKFCQRRFTELSSKGRHERTHTNTRPYLCSQCGKSFTNAWLLKNHMVIHTGERNFKCEVCQKTFSRKTHLSTHYRSLMHKQALERANSIEDTKESSVQELNSSKLNADEPLSNTELLQVCLEPSSLSAVNPKVSSDVAVPPVMESMVNTAMSSQQSTLQTYVCSGTKRRNKNNISNTGTATSSPITEVTTTTTTAELLTTFLE